MPGHILPLRVLTTSVSFSTITFASTTIQPSLGISVFSKVFPFKMKYMGFNSEGFGARRMSSFRGRSARGGGRSSGGGRVSEFSRRSSGDRDRGEFQGGGFGGRVGQAKSLIEDEDEISNWVSGLKPDSFRAGLSSGSDDDDSGRGGRGGSSRGRDMDNGRGRGRGRFSDSGRGRGRGRESGGVFRSERGDRGGMGGFSASKRPRESDSDEFDISDSDRRDPRRGTGPASFARGSRGSRGSMVSSGSRRRDFDKDVELPLRRESGSRTAVSSPGRRGGRDSDFSNGRSTGGGTLHTGRKYAPIVSEDDEDEDEDDDSDSSLGGLLSDDVDSEDDSDLDGDDNDDELVPKRNVQGIRGAISSPVKNSGRDSKLSNARSRGGGVLQKGRRQAFEVSDDDGDDVNEKSTLSFGDFLSDEDSEEERDQDVLKVKDVSSLQGSVRKDNTPRIPKISSEKADSYLSETRFDQCAISPLSLKGIKDAGYEKMTVVQEATLPVILKGKDVLAKARTGTGKTVAFLLPAIEAIVKSPPVDRDQKRPPINVLVMCPTRELASQAAAEATKLLKYHPSMGVQIVIGGVRLALEQKRMQANPCQILVATPGRLKDHIENTAGFATRLMGVKVLVLDEADHLLDMGFRKDIEKIIAALPKQRQTLLFSATVPEDVRQICHVALKRDHEYINTVEEGSEETHAQVRQTHLVAPLDKQFSLLYALLKDHIADDVDFKVLVFCTTAMVTRLVADLLSELKLNVREIHSRKPQSYRTRISDEFRKSKGLILVTSDVSARGVDYPDVTLVIQVGLPSDREQYIHRLGRTGRKGKEGQGILMLAPWEESFLSSLRDLPLTKASVPLVDPETRKKVERALSNVEMKNKEAAYQAWLGYYNSNKIVGRDKCRLVELASEFSRSMGLDNPPAIPKLILGKMGLKNVPGLRVK